jgi:hypothetical protein
LRVSAWNLRPFSQLFDRHHVFVPHPPEHLFIEVDLRRVGFALTDSKLRRRVTSPSFFFITTRSG